MSLFKPPPQHQKPINVSDELFEYDLRNKPWGRSGDLTGSRFDPSDHRWWAELNEETVNKHGDIESLKTWLDDKPKFQDQIRDARTKPKKVAESFSEKQFDVDFNRDRITKMSKAGFPEEWINDEVMRLNMSDASAPGEYQEEDLVDVGTYNLSDSTVKNLNDAPPWYQNRALLEPDAANDFLSFNGGFRSKFGKDIPLESAYRSGRHNSALKGSSDTSLHMQGKAFDVSFSKLTQEERSWLQTEAPNYGWEYHPYSGESTHFRYTNG